MRRDLTASIVAAVVFTVLCGLAYPLFTTGVAQVLFSDKADGSRVERDGEIVGSSLIAQNFMTREEIPEAERGKFGKKQVKTPDPSYFQPRPSVTGYSANVTFFNNLGPNNKELSQMFRGFLDAYLELEEPFTPGLGEGDVPVDAVTTSASGVDPHISVANARIQANRVAEVRGLDPDRVNELIDDNTDNRDLGVLGESGVNVLELNLALDEEGQ
ncbi:MAG TPA: potassium-transporting ATPase subunit C [Solirubrobacterales bacterium]|jgi:K+-transporting ATPase ATPase C chain|nr:potassium-transporting ATPase subunit C [Solirubrobacterales bacterium]